MSTHATRALISAFMAIGLAGCGDDSTAPNQSDDVTVWRIDRAPAQRLFDPVRGPALIAFDGTVLFDIGGGVLAVDVASGATRWTLPAEGTHSTLWELGALITFLRQPAAGLPETRTLSPATGALGWTVPTGYATAVQRGDVVFGFPSQAGPVSGWNATTGTPLWSTPVPSRLCVRFGPCNADRVLGTTSRGTLVYRERRNGVPAELLSATPTGEITRLPVSESVESAFNTSSWRGLLRDGTLAWAANSLLLTVINTATGDVVWRIGMLDRTGTGVTGYVTDVGVSNVGVGVRDVGDEAGPSLVSVAVGSDRVVATRWDALTGTELSTRTMLRRAEDTPMYWGRCRDSTFGYITTAGTLRFADITTGDERVRQSSTIPQFVDELVLPSASRNGFRASNGHVLFVVDPSTNPFSPRSAVTVGVACGA